MENAAVCPEPCGAATAAAETNDAKATREKRQAAALGGRVEDRIWALLDQRFGFEKVAQNTENRPLHSTARHCPWVARDSIMD